MSTSGTTERSAVLNWRASVLSLIAAAIPLVPAVAGALQLANGNGFWTTPEFVATYSLLFIVLVTLASGLGILRLVKHRSAVVARQGLEADGSRTMGYFLLVTVVWAALLAVWAFAVWSMPELFLRPRDREEFLVLSLVIGVPFGGWFISEACVAIDSLFRAD